MKGYADTGFLGSLFMEETTSEAAEKALARPGEPLPLIPLTMLEMRNTLNLGIVRGCLNEAERDAMWTTFEEQIAAGSFVETPIPGVELHAKARELSDRYPPTLATRSLDLLHVAAAVLLGAKVFYSFDERQRKAAAGEGLKILP